MKKFIALCFVAAFTTSMIIAQDAPKKDPATAPAPAKKETKKAPAKTKNDDKKAAPKSADTPK